MEITIPKINKEITINDYPILLDGARAYASHALYALTHDFKNAHLHTTQQELEDLTNVVISLNRLCLNREGAGKINNPAAGIPTTGKQEETHENCNEF